LGGLLTRLLAWVFATGPEPQNLDLEAAMVLANRVVDMTKQQDPVSLDTLAAAETVGGHSPARVTAICIDNQLLG
jgi:hypothetical protein